MWHYSFRSIKTTTSSDLQAESCKFSATNADIITMIYNVDDKELSIMKQDYDKGAVAWIRKIPGSFSSFQGGLNTFEEDYSANA